MLCICMMVTLLPATAWATDYHDLNVAGTNVVGENNITYWLCNTDGTITSTGASEDNYNVKYDTNTHILTLKNANIKSSAGNAIDDKNFHESLMIEQKGNNIVETGSYDGHKALLQYIRSHNLAVQENFDYIDTQIDVVEWTNYWITETFFGNTDTGNIRFYNSRSGNGKWRWILFDMDWALYPTTYQTNSIYQFIDPKGHGVGDSFSTTIAVNLMKNTDYKKFFVETYAEYLHTVFETERMLGILDEMIAQVDGEMQRHCARWKNLSYNNWKKNTEQLRQIVDARWEICVDDLRTTFHLSNAEMAELFPELYG